MHTADVVNLWERGRSVSPVERGLLLARRIADTNEGDCLGARNARILALRTHLFGTRYECVDRCPDCGHYVEFSFDASDLSATPPTETEFELRVADCLVRFRLPNSLDIAYLARFDRVDDAEKCLLERCVIDVRRADGVSLVVEDWPVAMCEALDERMNQLDPGAVHRIGLGCPDCGAAWSTLFDVVEYAWRELSRAAKRALADVHELAHAYGWTERDVFALSASRRSMYLELVRA